METWTNDDDLTSYASWLREKYGDVPSKFPPAFIVCFYDDELHEYAVIGYAVVDGQPTVKLIDLAELAITPYEDYGKKSRNVCPKHELPKLRYLYNRNGEEFARSFK